MLFPVAGSLRRFRLPEAVVTRAVPEFGVLVGTGVTTGMAVGTGVTDALPKVRNLLIT